MTNDILWVLRGTVHSEQYSRRQLLLSVHYVGEAYIAPTV